MENLIIIGVSLVSGLITYYINHYLNRGPVFASAMVALATGIVLPQILESGSTLAVMATCASYAGMSAKTRVTNLIEMGLGSVLCGFVFVASQNALVGHGGRLGTIAAISVITIWGAKQLINQISNYFSSKRDLESKSN